MRVSGIIFDRGQYDATTVQQIAPVSEMSSPYSFCYLIIRNVHWLMKLLDSIFHGSLMRTADEEKGESLTVSKQKVFVSCSANHSVFTSIYFENAATSLSFWPQRKTTQKTFNFGFCQVLQFIFALAYSRSTMTDICHSFGIVWKFLIRNMFYKGVVIETAFREYFSL